MRHQLAFINGKTLKTLRELRGVTCEYLCSKANIKPDQLGKWEHCSDSDYPTMRQAEKMAKTLLSPLAGLYLEPGNLPKEKIPSIVDKRKVPNSSAIDESSLNLAVYGLAQIRSDAIAMASDLSVSIPECSLFDLGNDVNAAASAIRKWLGFTLQSQKRTTSTRKLFLALRARLERRGVLVAQFDGISVEALRGIALYYDELPVIGVNSKDRWPAKTFSLLHEFVHLSKRNSAYCNLVDREADDEEEIFCNKVAGEFLFSRGSAIEEVSAGLNPSDVRSIEIVAKRYSVSRDVVARRLRDCGFLSKRAYEELLDVFSRDIAAQKEAEGRKRESGERTGYFSSYERKVADAYGSLYCSLIAQGLGSGLFSEGDACDALGVKPEKLGKVFKEAQL